jgi:DNA-binding MarR family transcriptional regulator
LITNNSGASDDELRARDRAETIERALAAFAVLMRHVASTHVPAFTETELTMAQAKAIYVAVAVGAVRMSDLAAQLGVTTSTASGLVDRLVDLDLLVRHADPDDRRHVLITTTEAARTHLEHLRELNQQQFRELLEQIGDADLPVVEHAIQIMAAAAEATRPVPRAIAGATQEAP